MPSWSQVGRGVKGVGAALGVGTAAVNLARGIKDLRAPVQAASPAIAGLRGLGEHVAAIGAVSGAAALGGMAVDQFKLHSSFNKMMQLYPELQREQPERVKLYFDSISNSSPSVAQQPLVVGSLIKRLLNYDGFDHSVHKDLVSAQSMLDKNTLQAHGNLINLGQVGLNALHTYRYGRT